MDDLRWANHGSRCRFVFGIYLSVFWILGYAVFCFAFVDRILFRQATGCVRGTVGDLAADCGMAATALADVQKVGSGGFTAIQYYVWMISTLCFPPFAGQNGWLLFGAGRKS